jgi:hypothetical protein
MQSWVMVYEHDSTTVQLPPPDDYKPRNYKQIMVTSLLKLLWALY